MQSFRILGVVAVLAFTSGAAFAAEPAARSVTDWKCEGDRCVAYAEAGAAAEDLLQQCKRTVRSTGPVSEYRRGGNALSAEQIRACNRFVIATQPPRN